MGAKDWIGPSVSALFGTSVGNAADQAFNPPSNKFKKQYKYQKEFAQNAIQWRVADAVAAGLHPLAALGMPVASYSPVNVGEDSRGSFQGALSDMGQDIASAAMANAPASSKFEAAYQGLQLENASLQNEKLRAEIMLMSQPGRKAQVFSPSGAKEDRLSSGGSEVVRDASGEAWILPPGVDANYIENRLGEGAGDFVGGHSAMTAFVNRMLSKGVWPGVLGY